MENRERRNTREEKKKEIKINRGMKDSGEGEETKKKKEEKRK